MINEEHVAALVKAAKKVVEQHGGYKPNCACAPCRLKEIVEKFNEVEDI